MLKHHKKAFFIVAAIIFLLAAYRTLNDHGIIGKSIAEEQAAGQCKADATALALNASSTNPMTDEQVAQTMFSNLMNQYVQMTGCREVTLSNYHINSLSIATSTDRFITAKISYDVEPANWRDTGWTHMGPRDGFWIRGIDAVLQIYRTSTGFFLSV